MYTKKLVVDFLNPFTKESRNNTDGGLTIFVLFVYFVVNDFRSVAIS